MAVVTTGVLSWEVDRDDDGHRDYTISHLVLCDSYNDGPQTVMGAAGLPTVGSYWAYGNDSDAWALCWPGMKIGLYQHKLGRPHLVWKVDQHFKTRPFKRCQDEDITDPLLEPQKVSGSFIKYTEEAAKDKDDAAILTVSHELVKGPQVEFDANRPTVRIEQNVAALGLNTFAEMVDTLNDDTLWNLAARKIKLDNVSWERLVYGTCGYYFKRVFDFSVAFNTFDRDILQEGTKALGDWDPTTKTWVVSGSVTNPQDFHQYKDKRGENCRVLLAATGAPLGAGADPVSFKVQKYPESDFLQLGIPTSFTA